MRADAGLEGTGLERFQRFWAHAIDSFRTSPEVWLATFDVFAVAQRDPQIRAAVAQGLDDGRALWARALYGLDPDGDGRGTARAVGSLHQALFSGVLVQWLIDPGRAPSAADLATALQAITRQLCAEQHTEAGEGRGATMTGTAELSAETRPPRGGP